MFFKTALNRFRKIHSMASKIGFFKAVLFLCLRQISVMVLKSSRRIFFFSLSEPMPAFTGYPISVDARIFLKKTCIVLQGPISKLEPRVTYAYAKAIKQEMGLGCVIYCGPQYEAMKPFCDYSIPPCIDLGAQNQFNLQRQSTLSGLEIALAQDFEFAIKLRADGVILRRDAPLQFHYRLLAKGKRIVAVAPQKPYYTPFLGDHIQFGKVKDLIEIWNQPWNGQLDISHPEGFSLANQVARSPEWVLGYNLFSAFGSGSFSILSPDSINYIFLKYDFFDAQRFDWESAPHFATTKYIPADESSLGNIEEDLVNFFDFSCYDKNLIIDGRAPAP